MNWEETVMKVTPKLTRKYSHLETYNIGDYDAPIECKELEWHITELLKAQAETTGEIAYKEGEVAGYRKGLEMRKLYQEGYKLGISIGRHEVINRIKKFGVGYVLKGYEDFFKKENGL